MKTAECAIPYILKHGRLTFCGMRGPIQSATLCATLQCSVVCSAALCSVASAAGVAQMLRRTLQPIHPRPLLRYRTQHSIETTQVPHQLVTERLLKTIKAVIFRPYNTKITWPLRTMEENMSINYIYSIFHFRNPGKRYVYAFFSGDLCLYVGVGVKYRCLNHLKYEKQVAKAPGVGDIEYMKKARKPITAINRAWMLGKPLSLFVSFVSQNLANEVEASLITELLPSANLNHVEKHRNGEKLAAHFLEPTFGNKLFKLNLRPPMN